MGFAEVDELRKLEQEHREKLQMAEFSHRLVSLGNHAADVAQHDEVLHFEQECSTCQSIILLTRLVRYGEQLIEARP